MKSLFRFVVLFSLLVFSLQLLAQISVVSGPRKEIYNQFAVDINNNTNIPMEILTSDGSVANLEMLKSDSVHIAFMQYDVLVYNEQVDKSIRDYIRVLLPLYYEEIHVVTKNNDKINSIKDLQGKKVGVGSSKTGASVTSRVMQLKTGIAWKDTYIPFSNCYQALLADSIDAFIYVGASPANFLSTFSANASQFIKLLPLEHEKLNDLYSSRVIEKGTYPWLINDITTYATRALLVVNIKNVSGKIAQQIDLLNVDLQDNLKGIQHNKFSHSKWQQVEFTNMDHVDWPVYKREYVTVKMVFDVLAYVAVLLTLFQIYFVLNKLWSRKHEKMVAESISVSAMFISILINCFFGFKNIMGNGLPQLTANIIWIGCSIVTTMVGIGFWVVSADGQKKSFFKLLKQALKLETQEAGDLAKAFFKPSSAEKVLDILGQLAMIDNELAEEEKKFIQSFADAWGININWDHIEKNFGTNNGYGYQTLRKSMKDYLSTNPPQQQASQLADVITLLVNVDSVVTAEEELMHAELNGLINKYLGQGDVDVFNAVVVPQNQEQEIRHKELLGELKRIRFAGGFAYVSESFYSYKYAETVCEKYRATNLFSVVVNVNKILEHIEPDKES